MMSQAKWRKVYKRALVLKRMGAEPRHCGTPSLRYSGEAQSKCGMIVNSSRIVSEHDVTCPDCLLRLPHPAFINESTGDER